MYFLGGGGGLLNKCKTEYFDIMYPTCYSDVLSYTFDSIGYCCWSYFFYFFLPKQKNFNALFWPRVHLWPTRGRKFTTKNNYTKCHFIITFFTGKL